MTKEIELVKMPHTVILESRKKVKITGVNDINSFDEENISLYTVEGEMEIKGEDLKVIKIDVAVGEVSIEGIITSISYNDMEEMKSGFFAKLFR